MSRALRSELRKLATLRITPGLLGLALAYILLNVVAVLALQGAGGGPADVATPGGLRVVLGIGSGAYLFSFVIGVLSATGEYRHGTITATLLAEPRRGRVIAAKLAASTLAGLLYGIAATALTLGVALPWLAFADHAPLSAATVAGIAAGTVAAVALFGALGAALGALVRSQVVALVAGLLWLTIGEGLLLAFLSEIGRWLPTGALSALAGTTEDVLPAWAGGLLLTAYVAALGIAAVVAAGRRDAL